MKPSNVLLVLLVCCGTAGAETVAVLTPNGLEPVRIGMTVSQAEQALGQKLTITYQGRRLKRTQACGFAWPQQGDVEGISYMVEQGRITRIDVGYKSVPRHPPVTVEGVGIGWSEEAVKKAYGSRVRVEAHTYDEQGHYLIVDEPGQKRGTIFETDGRKVTSFRAGEYPAALAVEGCL